MAVNLDPRCREQLVLKLAASLQDAIVLYGHYVSASWIPVGQEVMLVLPQTEKARIAAGLAGLSNLTLTFFAFDELSEPLKDRPPQETESPTKLSSFEGYENLRDVAVRVVSALETLPWEYEIILRTPIGAEAPASIRLDDTFALRSFSAESAAEYPLEKTSLPMEILYHQEYPKEIRTDIYYLVGHFRGFIERFEPSESELTSDALKSVLGMSLVTGRLVLTNLKSYGAPPPTAPVLIYRIVNGQRKLLPYRWLSAEDSTLLSRLSFQDRRPETFPIVLAALQAAFQHAPTRSAARWYLDSFAGSNGLLQIVQATVVLEILLGDKADSDEMGLTALLANRLAFMIGQSPSARAAIVDDFKDLYDVRSSIVHAGRSILDESERNSLGRIREYARRVLETHLEQLWIEQGKPQGPR